jgi:hypothetical protein
MEFCVEDFRHHKEDRLHTQPEASTIPSYTRNYVQALINLARLWAQIWDTFFAVGADKKTDWMEIEIMDTQILNSRRQLSPELSWDAARMVEYAVAGKGEPNLRRRLHLYTVS